MNQENISIQANTTYLSETLAKKLNKNETSKSDLLAEIWKKMTVKEKEYHRLVEICQTNYKKPEDLTKCVDIYRDSHCNGKLTKKRRCDVRQKVNRIIKKIKTKKDPTQYHKGGGRKRTVAIFYTHISHFTFVAKVKKLVCSKKGKRGIGIRKAAKKLKKNPGYRLHSKGSEKCSGCQEKETTKGPKNDSAAQERQEEEIKAIGQVVGV